MKDKHPTGLSDRVKQGFTEKIDERQSTLKNKGKNIQEKMERTRSTDQGALKR